VTCVTESAAKLNEGAFGRLRGFSRSSPHSYNSGGLILRRSVGVLLLAAVAALGASAATSPEASLDLGMRAFRAADYASAVVDLRAAADAYGSGVSHQTALVYLALAQFRLGEEDAARASIQRLLEAERTQPAYATLPLQGDAADYEALVAALVPESTLPRNTHLVVEDQGAALPTVRPATPAVEAATDVRIEQIQEQTEQRIAEIEAEADRRIAAIQAEADRRIAAAQAAANARVAAAQAEADRRVAAAEATAAAAVPSGVTGSQPVTRTPVSNAPALTTLRQADELARTGDLDAAHGLYVRLASDDGVAREVLAESAVGLYRIGSYREAVDAFRRMNVFARGEEDLRYYFAVALYETGQYREAQKELSCALPFIQVTDDVARYRMKIEQSAAVTVARNF
jgi:tetratricopeptide (TPR) repeat protein